MRSREHRAHTAHFLGGKRSLSRRLAPPGPVASGQAWPHVATVPGAAFAQEKRQVRPTDGRPASAWARARSRPQAPADTGGVGKARVLTHFHNHQPLRGAGNLSAGVCAAAETGCPAGRLLAPTRARVCVLGDQKPGSTCFPVSYLFVRVPKRSPNLCLYTAHAGSSAGGRRRPPWENRPFTDGRVQGAGQTQGS